MAQGTKEALREVIVHTGPAEPERSSSLQGHEFKDDKPFDKDQLLIT